MGIPNPLDLIPRSVRPFDPEEVTSAEGSQEVEPETGGLTEEDIDEIWRSVEEIYRTRLHPAVALCLMRRGRVVIDRAIGHARGNSPDDPADADLVPAKPTTLYNIFSVSKAVTATVIHMLDEQGYLHIDDPVAEYIPEFARHGKEKITIRHVLTHRAGIPNIPARHGGKEGLKALGDPDLALSILCEAKPTWRPGRVLAYHALTGGFILGEIARRVTGDDIRTVLRERILGPIGVERMSYGVKPEEIGLVAENAFTGFPPLPPYSWLLERSLGASIRDVGEASNDPRFLTGLIPSGNVIGTPADIARFFQLLLNRGTLDGVRILSPRTVARAVAEQTYLEFDLTLSVPTRYGMGFMLGAQYVSLYGPGTPQAFGHLGFSYVLAYADPEREISVCLITTGKPFVTPEMLRWYRTVWLIASRCL